MRRSIRLVTSSGSVAASWLAKHAAERHLELAAVQTLSAAHQRCLRGFHLDISYPPQTNARQNSAAASHIRAELAAQTRSFASSRQKRLRAAASRLPSPRERAEQDAAERDTAQQDAQASQNNTSSGAAADTAAAHHAVTPGTGSEIVPSEAPATAVEVAAVVDHPALIITRNIEWGNVILGFEQCNKYTVYDEKGDVVALIAEDAGGIGTAIGRQVLRRRRPLVATVLSPDGSRVVFRVRRPFYLINSSIFIEDGTGAVVGEVHQSWHLWRRRYDLFMGKRQLAHIDGGFLAWEFVLRDENGGVLALIDRNFQGFGKELFTDAGKYVVHFGNSPKQAAEQAANTIAAAHPDKPRPQITPMAEARNTDLAVIPTSTGDQLDVVRSLGISDRMAVLAAAISIDFDYFSQHSQGSGMMPFFMPMPFPSYPEDAAPGGDAAGGGAEGAAGGGQDDSDRGSEAGGGHAAEVGAGAAGGASGEAAADTWRGGREDKTPDPGVSNDGGWGGGGWGSGGGGGGGTPADADEVNLGGDEWGGESDWGDELGESASDAGEGASGLLGDIWGALSGSD